MELTIEGGVKNEKEKKVKRMGVACVIILFRNYSRAYFTKGGTMTFKEESRLFRELSKFRVRCKCSHSVYIGRMDRMMCSHCGEWVYRTPELQFKYKMKEVLKKEETNDNEIRQTRQICNT